MGQNSHTPSSPHPGLGFEKGWGIKRENEEMDEGAGMVGRRGGCVSFSVYVFMY